MRLPVLLLLLSLPATAQELRHAVATADLVAVATDSGVRPLGKDWILHRLQVHNPLKGKSEDVITVVESKAACLPQRPAPGEKRLYCLQRYDDEAARAGLPADFGPYFRMLGHAGSNPPISTNLEADPFARLVRLVIASEEGLAPGPASQQALALTLQSERQVRLEATGMLTDREILRKALTPVQWSEVLQRAVGETDDIPYKIALSQLCAEHRLAGVVEALCVSVPQVADPTFAPALGRIAKLLHGEKAAELLRPHAQSARRPDIRGRYLMALACTETDAALNALLRFRETLGQDPYLDAALLAHGSKRAVEAAGPASRPGEEGKK
jgi:hypothetical protein